VRFENTDVPAFNQLIKDQKIPAIVVKPGDNRRSIANAMPD